MSWDDTPEEGGTDGYEQCRAGPLPAGADTGADAGAGAGAGAGTSAAAEPDGAVGPVG